MHYILVTGYDKLIGIKSKNICLCLEFDMEFGA